MKKHILKNGGAHDGQECKYTMCYSNNPEIKDKCLGWCMAKAHNHNSEIIDNLIKNITPQQFKTTGFLMDLEIILNPKYMNDVFTWKQICDAIEKINKNETI